LQPVRVAATEEREADQLALFDLGVNMRALKEQRARLLSSGLAERTIEAYQEDWDDFLGWCRAAGRVPLPATAETLELYIVDRAASCKIWTLRRRLSGITAAHKGAGYGLEKSGALAVIRSLRRERGDDAEPREALGLDQLHAMLAAMPDTARGRRDRAIVLLGLATGCRRSELAGLDVGDLRFVEKGVAVRIRKSKTDQEGEGRLVGVFASGRPTCPVAAVRAWLEVRGRWGGALFCQLGGRGGAVLRLRLSGQSIAAAVKHAARLAGLDPARLSGHSLRAGCVTAAIESGATVPQVMARTGHRQVQTLAKYYRPASVWTENPLAQAL